MWKRKRVWAIALFACLVVATIPLLPDRFIYGPEPMYHGRSLSRWLLLTREREYAEAEEAIARIGTNATPYLLKWMRYERPHATQKLASATNWIRRSAFGEDVHNDYKIFVSRSEALADSSEDALIQLGTNASAAVPQLTAMMRDTNARYSAYRAMHVLRHLGTNGLSPLIAAAKDPQYPFRTGAVANLATAPITAESSPLIARSLIELLNDNSLGQQRGTVSLLLGSREIEPQLSVPALLDCVANTNIPISVRESVFIGLRFREAQQALPALTNMLTASDPAEREFATRWIQNITPRPRATNVAPQPPQFRIIPLPGENNAGNGNAVKP
jgi:hypothetical protein